MADPETQTDLPVHPDVTFKCEFDTEEMDFLAVAEGVLQFEFDRAAEPFGLSHTSEEIPEKIVERLKIQGRWTLEYATAADINIPRA